MLGIGTAGIVIGCFKRLFFHEFGTDYANGGSDLSKKGGPILVWPGMPVFVGLFGKFAMNVYSGLRRREAWGKENIYALVGLQWSWCQLCRSQLSYRSYRYWQGRIVIKVGINEEPSSELSIGTLSALSQGCEFLLKRYLKAQQVVHSKISQSFFWIRPKQRVDEV